MTPTTLTATRHRHTGTGRRLGILLALIVAWMIGLYATPSISMAAERGETASTTVGPHTDPSADDPFATIGAKLETTAKNVAKIATPVAIVCIVIVLVMYLFAPLLPDIAQQNKGYIIRALVIVAMIGFIPELVKAVAAFGNS